MTTWRQPTGEQRDIQDYGQHPVTRVSKSDALAYCQWLSKVTGKAYGLPTQKQWEKAARGTDGRTYPWGYDEPNRRLCNIERWFESTTAVGRYSPAGDGPRFDNRYGCADLVGNVWEWTADAHTVDYTFYEECDPDRPVPKRTTNYIVCGASWCSGRQRLHEGQRWGAAYDDLGFRVVVNPPTGTASASNRTR